MGAMRMEPVVSDMHEMDPPRLEREEEEPRTHKQGLDISEGQGGTREGP